jgi:membrane protein implicated in regulation of membrane protease activity
VLAFLTIGTVGLVLLALSISVDFLDVPGVDSLAVDHDLIVLPVLSAGLAAFGFGAALLLSATSSGPGLAAAGGAGSAVLVGRLAVSLVRMMLRQPVTEAPNGSHFVGAFGIVVTGVPPDGLGEISVRRDGTLHKFSARADEPLPIGTDVCVLGSLSPTCMRVRRVDLT